MITSKRSQLGKLLEDRPDMIIHNSWNHRDKDNEEIQQREFDASVALIQYAISKGKWFVFISTTSDNDNFYVQKKRAVEEIVKKTLPDKHMIIKLPTLIAGGTIFMLLESAGSLVNQLTLGKCSGEFYPDPNAIYIVGGK
jgi:hypothetical protein